MKRTPSTGRAAAMAGAALLALIAAASAAAPLIATHDPTTAFRDRAFAPPMRPRIVDAEGRLRAPFVYPLRLVSRLEQRYEEDRSRAVPLSFFSAGHVVRLSDESDGPWLPLGADASGRDVMARLLFGARTSLGLALVASLSAILLGIVVGVVAGYAGGLTDEALMRIAEFALVLPAVYIVLALRAVMPLVLSPWAVFALMTAIFALVGWPWVARAVRGVVATEASRDYVAAARSIGAGPARIMVVHLLPACVPVIAAQTILLVPGFVLAEATLSYLGLGFPDSVPSWGSMLQDAANVNVIARFPWMLLPAAAIFAVTLGVNLLLESRGAGRLLESPSGGSR